jgi:hypothetical protein
LECASGQAYSNTFDPNNFSISHRKNKELTKESKEINNNRAALYGVY